MQSVMEPPMIDEREHRRRLRLLRKAHNGDVGALCILREMYQLRLPLVEQKLPYIFPWMRARPRRRAPGPVRTRRQERLRGKPQLRMAS